ncbi:MAG: hypothetical protein N2490_07125 [Ignavibacteria bacterium]|nr:hypothetical protein [Ignavibacteria bacterium]
MKKSIKILFPFSLLIIIVFATTLDSKSVILNSKNDINQINNAMKKYSEDVYVYICDNDETWSLY